MYILTNNNNNNNSKADIYFKLTIKVSHCFFFPIGQTDSTDHSFGSRSVLSQQNWTIRPWCLCNYGGQKLQKKKKSQ